MSNPYDLLVIGGGSAGYAAARTAHELGKRVAIVDGAGKLGGLCILRGCMPSKTLIYAAEVLHLARNGHSFGLDIPEAHVDMSALHARKQRLVNEFATYRQEQLQSERFTLYRQQARFTGPHTVLLDDGQKLEAAKILIATGSIDNWPSLPGLDPLKSWTSDHILDLNNVPESVIVLGGGVIACELAQFLARIGTQVIQIQRSKHLLKTHSPHAARVIEQTFREEGIELLTETHLETVAYTDDAVEITFEHAGKRLTRCAKHLFNALGRKPATGNLDLDKANVQTLSSGHIATNSFQQSTSNLDVYAAGDCAGPHEIVHTAILQGECAARHAFGASAEPLDESTLTSIVFTDPQIAHVGPSEADLQARSADLLVADYPFDDHGKSLLMEATRGYVKTWAERSTGRLIAAECVGKDAGELIHAMAVAVSLRATIKDLLKVQWYHPTLSEIWTYPLEEIAEAL